MRKSHPDYKPDPYHQPDAIKRRALHSLAALGQFEGMRRPAPPRFIETKYDSQEEIVVKDKPGGEKQKVVITWYHREVRPSTPGNRAWRRSNR